MHMCEFMFCVLLDFKFVDFGFVWFVCRGFGVCVWGLLGYVVYALVWRVGLVCIKVFFILIIVGFLLSKFMYCVSLVFKFLSRICFCLFCLWARPVGRTLCRLFFSVCVLGCLVGVAMCLGVWFDLFGVLVILVWVSFGYVFVFLIVIGYVFFVVVFCCTFCF